MRQPRNSWPRSKRWAEWPLAEVSPMFRSFTVKNFRCFRDLTISSLERVNLIGGKNNVGKTALLEALFLHLGANTPLVPMNINIFRGIEQSSSDPKELWGWLFFNKRAQNVIEL